MRAEERRTSAPLSCAWRSRRSRRASGSCRRPARPRRPRSPRSGRGNSVPPSRDTFSVKGATLPSARPDLARASSRRLLGLVLVVHGGELDHPPGRDRDASRDRFLARRRRGLVLILRLAPDDDLVLIGRRRSRPRGGKAGLDLAARRERRRRGQAGDGSSARRTRSAPARRPGPRPAAGPAAGPTSQRKGEVGVVAEPPAAEATTGRMEARSSGRPELWRRRRRRGLGIDRLAAGAPRRRRRALPLGLRHHRRRAGAGIGAGQVGLRPAR